MDGAVGAGFTGGGDLLPLRKGARCALATEDVWPEEEKESSCGSLLGDLLLIMAWMCLPLSAMGAARIALCVAAFGLRKPNELSVSKNPLHYAA